MIEQLRNKPENQTKFVIFFSREIFSFKVVEKLFIVYLYNDV